MQSRMMDAYDPKGTVREAAQERRRQGHGVDLLHRFFTANGVHVSRATVARWMADFDAQQSKRRRDAIARASRQLQLRRKAVGHR